MRRISLLLIAVLLIGAGYVIAARPWGSVTAQEDRVIPVIALREQSMLFPGQKVGDACHFSRRSENGAMVPGQLIAKDPAGQIKGYAMITGKLTPSSETGYFCGAEFDMAVTIEDYVSVYFDGDFVRTYAAADFPLSQPDGISISMPND